MFLTSRVNVRGVLSSNSIPESCLGPCWRESILPILPELKRGIRLFSLSVNCFQQLLYFDRTDGVAWVRKRVLPRILLLPRGSAFTPLQ
jgi:hypothetical protein